MIYCRLDSLRVPNCSAKLTHYHLSVAKMSKKAPKFSSRPKPPTEKEIIEDIKSCNDNDIAFALYRDLKPAQSPSSETANLMTESFVSQDDILGSPLASSTDSTPDEAGTKHVPNIDYLYKQALQFLEVSEQLTHAPVSLKTKCEELQKLDNDLKESIECLKKQSQHVLKTS